MTASVLDIPTARVFLPLLKPARFKGARGGRGSGKSRFFAGLAVEESFARKVDIVCIREVQGTLDQSAKKTIEGTIQRMGLGQHFEVQRDVIYSQRGGRFIFKGMQDFNAENIKSLEDYDIAWIEEARNISKRSLDLLIPTIRKKGSEIWMSWNPEREDDPVEEFWREENRPENSVLVTANYWDNPWFRETELPADMERDRKRDPERYQHIWCGAYKAMAEALVFKNWQVASFDTPTGAMFRFGADWGYATDPTVLVRCFVDGRKLFVDHEAYMVGCEIDMLPDLFDRVPESRKFFITADSARPETISYMRAHGFPRINSAVKGTGSVEDGIEWLKSFDIIVHPRCERLLAELKSYSWKVDKLTGKVLPMLEDKNNHCIDALRYACEAVRKNAKPASGEARTLRRTVHGGPYGWMGA